MTELTRILIADDHPIFRDGLVRTVERNKSFVVVGQAGDGAEALQLIRDLRPDVAILDIAMPKLDGLEVARRVYQDALPTELVILTMYRDAKYFNAALDLGVRGYLLKDSASTELMACLEAVTSSVYYVSPTVSHLLIEREKRAASVTPSASFRETFTPAELTVLRLVAANLSNKEIAERLSVSMRTIENHRAHMCQKLGIRGHNALLQFALENRSEL